MGSEVEMLLSQRRCSRKGMQVFARVITTYREETISVFVIHSEGKRIGVRDNMVKKLHIDA
jgi:hypothetical protein